MGERTNEAVKRPSTLASLWVAAISAAIGFAAVYVTLGQPDNAAGPGQAGGRVAAPVAGVETRPAAGANSVPGAMAGFVKRAEPQALADVSFVGPGGTAMKLSDFKGRTVLLNLWATWCAPCRREMPSLDRLQKALGSDKFEVVALAVDRTGLEGAGRFLAETKVESLKLYADPTAKAGNALTAIGMPTTILVGPDGRELGRLSGPAEWDSADAVKLVEAALR